MKYILGMIIALFLVLPSSIYSQQSGQGKADQPGKAKSSQPAPATSQPTPAAAKPAPEKANQPVPAKNGTPAQAQKEKPAFFTKINGDCLIRPKAGPEAGKWVRVAKPGQKIESGDDILVRTGDVEIELFSETTVKLQAECMVTYFQGRENIRPLAFIRPDYPTTKIKVTKGTIFAKVSPYEISKHFVVFDTPSGVAGVRGTNFSLAVDANGQLSVTTTDGQVIVADPSGNFTVDIGVGVQAILKQNPDGSFSIQSPVGQAVAYSPNTTFRIGQGGKLNLDLDESGTTQATVPGDSGGSVNVQVGNVQANLNSGQGVNLGSQGNGTTIESTGTGTVFSTVDGKNVVSMGEGAKVLVTVDSTGTTIEGQSGNTTVTGPNGEPKNLQTGENVRFDNTNQVNVEGEPCTPSVSPYNTCP
jgi:hypothetical protein